jgi:hypothetical protein
MSNTPQPNKTPRATLIRRTTASIDRMAEQAQSDEFVAQLPPASEIRAMREELRSARQPSIDREIEAELRAARK